MLCEDRLAVIARTAPSKAMPAPPDFARELELELEAAQSEVDSRDAADSRELTTCVICFEPCDPRCQQFPLEALPCALEAMPTGVA